MELFHTKIGRLSQKKCAKQDGAYIIGMLKRSNKRKIIKELMKKKNLSASELLMKIHDMLYPEQHRERYEFCEKNKGVMT